MRFFKERQYYMLARVNSWLEKKKDKLYPKVPVLKKLIPKYNEMFTGVHKLVVGKLKTTAIDTSHKLTAKTGLIEDVMKLVAVLQAFHETTDKKELPPEARHTPSVLGRISAGALSKIARQVIDAAKKVPDIREYGLSPGDIKETEAYLEEYTAVKSAPQLRRKEIAGYNQTINDGIRDCILFLETKLDPMMRIATAGNHELKAGYFASRKVMTRGAGAITEKEEKYRKSRKSAKGRIRNGQKPKARSK